MSLPAGASHWVRYGHYGLALGALLAFYVPYLFFPVVYVGGIAEDHWGEYATTVFSLTGAVLAGYACRRGWRWDQLGVYLFIAALFFFGMEEVSWAQRIVGFSTPDWFQAGNVQNETTLHNFAKLNWLQRYLGSALLFWAVASAWGVPRMPALSRWLSSWGFPLARPHTVPVFFVASYFLASKPLPFSDEAAECLFAFSMFVLAANMFAEANHISQRSRVVTLTLLPVWTVISVVLLERYAPGDDIHGWRSLRLAQKMESRGLCEQAVTLYEGYLAQDARGVSDALVAYHDVLVEMGDSDKAKQQVTSYLPSLLADDSAQAAWTAGLLAQKLPLPASADVYFAQAEQRAKVSLLSWPHNQGLVRVLAFSLAAQGRVEEAKAVAVEAITVAPNAQVRDDMGVVRDQLAEWLEHEPKTVKRAVGWWDMYALRPKGYCQSAR